MPTGKMLLCDFCVILLFTIQFAVADDKATSPKEESDVKGRCSCGGYPTQTPDLGALPLLSQSPDLIIKCDDEGEATCKKLCTALATAAKAQGPDLVCSKLRNANELKLSAFYKICEKPWTYMENMTETRPLCCDAGKAITCASEPRKGNCTCGAFASKSPEAGTPPVLIQTIDPVMCDEDGDIACKRGCAALAMDKKTTAADFLCKTLNNTEDLKLSAFYKPCEKPWVYIANMTATKPVCCESGSMKLSAFYKSCGKKWKHIRHMTGTLCCVNGIPVFCKSEAKNIGTCTCGAFLIQKPERGDNVPLVFRNVGLFSCYYGEGNACVKVCADLAKSSRVAAEKQICMALKDAEQVKISAFYKICGKPWRYIENMTRVLCCVDSKVQQCLPKADTGNCKCGAFPTPLEIDGAEPILAKDVAPVKCDVKGKMICKERCVDLAKQKQAAIAHNICKNLESVEEMKISVFYKACARPWLYAAWSLPRLICCESGQEKECQSTLRLAPSAVVPYLALADDLDVYRPNRI